MHLRSYVNRSANITFGANSTVAETKIAKLELILTT